MKKNRQIPNAAVKLSGDIIHCLLKGRGRKSKEPIINWLKAVGQKYHLVVICGGGTQISREFKKKGIKISFGPAGREISSFQHRQMARNILEELQVELQDFLQIMGIKADVEIPCREVRTVLCHANADNYIKYLCYNGFDKLYAVTLPDRHNEKKNRFKNFPKIEVVSFDVSE